MSESDLTVRLVESLNETYGAHPGHRAAHAKGVLCGGTFTPTPAAAELCRAEHFRTAVRAHVRFSNGSGDPAALDAARDGRGMAIKLYLTSGTTDIVALSLPAFFARTPEDLLAFNEARRVDPSTGVPDLDRVMAFLASHPEAATAVDAAMTHPIPASYATIRYHGLHSFGFESSDGEIAFGRYHLVPEAPEQSIDEADAAARPADFLRAELETRFSSEPAAFRLHIELAGSDDPIDDPTAVWPPDRTVVDMGRLEVTALAYDRERDGDVLVFDPTRVTDGITLSGDPILHARAAVYAESVARRTSS